MCADAFKTFAAPIKRSSAMYKLCLNGEACYKISLCHRSADYNVSFKLVFLFVVSETSFLNIVSISWQGLDFAFIDELMQDILLPLAVVEN